jgi:hypothetical protein
VFRYHLHVVGNSDPVVQFGALCYGGIGQSRKNLPTLGRNLSPGPSSSYRLELHGRSDGSVRPGSRGVTARFRIGPECNRLCRRGWRLLEFDSCNGCLTSSLRTTIEVAKADVWSHWTTLSVQIERGSLFCQHCAVWTVWLIAITISEGAVSSS